MESIQNAALNREDKLETTRTAKVYTLSGPATELLLPGSGVVIVANGNSTFYDQLEQAVVSLDTDKINDLAYKNKLAVNKLNKVSDEEALAALKAAPFIVDLNYGTKTIAINLFTIKDVEITKVLFAFSGGDFDANNFKYTVYSDDELIIEPKVMVILHQPHLSELEKQAVNIPIERSSMKFGKVGGDDTQFATPALITATLTPGILVATVATIVGSRCLKWYQEATTNDIPAAAFKTSNPTVKELVLARQKIIARTI
ncbi:hypothetical protein [Mucilaginibacter ginsenosidivorax]|uniref:Uncharacterized protein n=1 Tax=Mucilaginibacter ginsenosidivorax TaxID=862126 RepID=A0A5B8W196_9SPHI|nr:hypothetical protein [Mucilaginibacter ginsenosidivorax]QEC76028.1 hypothetical protein FSB76_08740 [Mucilaginibacter ginsenosidivorax]